MYCGFSRLVVSVLGSDVDDAGVTDPRLHTVLKSAMLESPDVWIITDGRNSGVSKLIAGIMDEIRSARQEEYTVPVIGIVPWKSLTTESDKRKSKSKVNGLSRHSLAHALRPVCLIGVHI